MKLVTDMTSQEACDFFLKHESYCNFPLPPYFDFHPILLATKKALDKKENGLKDIGLYSASNYDSVNYVLQTNKDGHYLWRPLQLIHPALYVHLVSEITKDENWNIIKESFKTNDKISVASLPREASEEVCSDTAEAVMSWWHDVEQLSIEKSLDFKYIFHTDISSFYPSIYTHSIPWAVHTKGIAKEKRDDMKCIGNVIDKAIRCMQNGQTNGIPQGSVLMDFIAEIILGYADRELTEKLEAQDINDYYIIRYRDDYRVFTNSKEDNETIARAITLTLQELGLQLNASKTNSSEDVVLSSIKEDKLEAIWLFSKVQREPTIQKSLLKLVLFSRKHPNSGQIHRQLVKISKRLETKKCLNEKPKPIISIITDIMINNPSSFTSCALVLSKILKFVDSESEKIELLYKIKSKFENILDTGFLDIWLQRISFSIDPDMSFHEKLCKVVANEPDIEIWKSDWIENVNFKRDCLTTSIINREILEECDTEIAEKEVALFAYDEDISEENEKFNSFAYSHDVDHSFSLKLITDSHRS